MPEIRSLTAVRGFAALWIVLHHFWPQTSSQTPYLIAKGYLAVDLFFILSGLVLYLVYEKSLRHGQFKIGRFALKRFARLYPVHLVTMVIAVVILSIGPFFAAGAREPSYDFGQMIFLHLTLLHAWGLTETGGLNYPSWSLGAEAVAYVLFPMLAYVTLKTRFALFWGVSIFVLCFLTFEWFWPDSMRNPTDDFVFTRLENDFGALRILPEFILGLCCAKTIRTLKNSQLWIIIGTTLTLCGIAGNWDLITVLGFAALLSGCALSNRTISRAAHRLGVLSYSIYMSHALVQITGFKLIEQAFGYDDRAVPALFLIPMLGLTMLCAWVLFHCVERPAHRWIVSLSKTGFRRPKATRSAPM